CGDLIFDKHVFKVVGGGGGDVGGGCRLRSFFYHQQCLKCTVCRNSLVQQSRCYVKGDQHSPHCKSCYQRQFGVKCARCSRSIQATDWVRRAKQLVYHLACFACDTCKRQLSTGEEFALQDSKLLCKQHYTELFDCENSKGIL
uniref:LIM zinc-binding domain-containing protein n=1 Tax=Romanomermis culicivorax TaxID=13658 RepID=A0A915HVU6_ROMCU